MRDAITSNGDTVLLRIKVTPGAKQATIGGQYIAANNDQSLCIKVQQPADDGKANKAVILSLAKALKVTKSQMSIERGAHSRFKTIRIEHPNPFTLSTLTHLLQRD